MADDPKDIPPPPDVISQSGNVEEAVSEVLNVETDSKATEAVEQEVAETSSSTGSKAQEDNQIPDSKMNEAMSDVQCDSPDDSPDDRTISEKAPMAGVSGVTPSSTVPADKSDSDDSPVGGGTYGDSDQSMGEEKESPVQGTSSSSGTAAAKVSLPSLWWQWVLSREIV